MNKIDIGLKYEVLFWAVLILLVVHLFTGVTVYRDMIELNIFALRVLKSWFSLLPDSMSFCESRFMIRDCSTRDVGKNKSTRAYLQGLMYWQAGHDDDAAACWSGSEAAVSKVVWQGINAYKSSDPQAITWLEIAAQISQTSEQERLAHFYLGKAYARLGDNSQALRHYKIAICNYVAYSLVAPSDSNIYVAMADAEGELGNWDMAKRHLNLAITCSPDNATAWYNLGQLLYRREGNLDSAIGALRNADLADSQNPRYLGQIAAWFRNGGRLADAIITYDELFSRKIADHWIYVGLAQTYVLQGNFEAARTVALECAEMPSWSWFGGCWKWTGIASLHLQDYSSAVTYLSKAVENGSQLSDICELMPVDVYDRVNDPEIARRIQSLVTQYCIKP